MGQGGGLYHARFNTQPPEGGCHARHQLQHGAHQGFNTQPPEGGCHRGIALRLVSVVSTHSRPKAAALGLNVPMAFLLFQHTAARRRLRLRHA